MKNQKFPIATIPNINTTPFNGMNDNYNFVFSHFMGNLGIFPSNLSLNEVNSGVFDLLLSNGYCLVNKDLTIGKDYSYLDAMFDDEEVLSSYKEETNKNIKVFAPELSGYNKLLFCNNDSTADFSKKEILLSLYRENKNWKIDIYYDLNNYKAVETIEKLAVEISEKYIDNSNKNKVSLLVKAGPNITFKPFQLISPEVDLELNYGKDFIGHHEKILDVFGQNKSFLTLLTGEPGTGKSFYIKHLAGLVDREFIYIPNEFVSSLESPDLLSLLLKKQNAIIILEDAEKVVLARDGGNNGLVSTILNLSDGILGDLLNIGFIITYNNCKNLDIDPAILRKGRLKYKYEFGQLSIEDAQNKVNSLKIDYKVTEPMTLAEIYNLEFSNNNEGKEEKKIGF